MDEAVTISIIKNGWKLHPSSNRRKVGSYMKREVLQKDKEEYRIKSIPEEEFKEKMQEGVEPLLNEIRQHGFFSRVGEEKIYYEKYLAQTAKRSIVICHGFNENSEKYKEMIYYFYRENCNVFVLDHQGHGKSFRMVDDYSVTHVEKFKDYVEDLRMFMKMIVEKDSKKIPIILFAHSMGGAIGGTYLEKYPGDFTKAVFSSPMFEIDSGKIPQWIGKIIADFKVMTGHKRDYIFIHSKFNDKERFEDSLAVSKERYDYFFKKRLLNKEYQNYCASYSWFQQSVLATKRLMKPENLAKIRIPILVFQAEHDTTVKAEGQLKFVKGVRHARLVFVPDSKHEIFMARSDVMTPYLNRIFEFIVK